MIPDLYGRCDLMPPNTAWERFRWYGIECFLSVCLTTQAFQVGDPYGMVPWLSYWALFAYCFHVAFARVFPIPYGAALTYSTLIVFYALHQWTMPDDPKDDNRSKGQNRLNSGAPATSPSSTPRSTAGKPDADT